MELQIHSCMLLCLLITMLLSYNTTTTTTLEPPIPSNVSQWLAFIWTRRCSAMLSILGSCAIVYIIVINRKRKLSRVHNRLLLSMSCIDILSSMANVITTSAIPRGTDPYSYGASGTIGTCNAQGFFLQLGFGAPTYNSMLCIHYLLFVKYRVREKVIAKKIEPFMHAVAILYPLSTAIASLFLGLFNPIITHCHIAAYPSICDIRGIECTRGNNAANYRLFFNGLELIIMFAVNITCMISLVLFIRKREKAVSRYQNRRSKSSSGNSSESEDATKQALLYMAAFVLTYIWGSIISAFIYFNGSHRAFLIVMSYLGAIFNPLQGFFNFIIYIRPRFNSVRRSNKAKSFLWVVRNTMNPTTNTERSMNMNTERSMNMIGLRTFTRCSIAEHEFDPPESEIGTNE